MNPYREFARSFARLVKDGASLPLGDFPLPERPRLLADGPAALIFSPHPDDECLIGGLALRLMREKAMRVINVAVTLGSKPERRDARRLELTNACNWLGFDLEQTGPDGLEKINLTTRERDPQHWSKAAAVIASTIARHQPRVIFLPHESDWHGTHIGTHFLVMDALKTLPTDFQCHLVETEFWGQMASPNLMVESSVEDLADLLAALSFHAGELRRNPYHLRMPAWMQDNVRRGAERVSGAGGQAPDFEFATLYRVGLWRKGGVATAYNGGRHISMRDDPGGILHPANY